MGFWSRLRGIFTKGPYGPGGPTVTWSTQIGGAAPRRGTRALLEAYRTMPWLQATAGRLANEAANAVKLRLYDGPEDDDQRSQIPTTDQRYWMLEMLRKPTLLATGVKMSARERWKLTHLWLSIVGEAGLIKQRGPTGLVTGLTPCNPYWVKRLPCPDEPYYFVQVDKDLGPSKVKPNDMIWLRNPDPLNPFGRGVGTAESLADELDTDEYTAKYIKAWYVNGGLPDTIITAKGADKKALEAAEEKFRQRYQGPRKAHQIHWSGADLAVNRLDTNFKDQDLVKMREFLRNTIIQVYGISPEILGILDSSTRDSTDNAYYLLALGVLVPWLEQVCDALQSELVDEFSSGGPCWVGYKSPIPEDRLLKLRAIATAPSAFRVRDAREVGGFAPDAELGDLRLAEKPTTAGPTNLPPGKGGDPEFTKHLLPAA